MPAKRRASLSLGRAKDDAEIRTARTIAGAARAGQDRSDSARDAGRQSGAGRHAGTNAASDRPASARSVRVDEEGIEDRHRQRAQPLTIPLPDYRRNRLSEVRAADMIAVPPIVGECTSS